MLMKTATVKDGSPESHKVSDRDFFVYRRIFTASPDLLVDSNQPRGSGPMRRLLPHSQGVTQPGRELGLEPSSRRFKSCRPDQFSSASTESPRPVRGRHVGCVGDTTLPRRLDGRRECLPEQLQPVTAGETAQLLGTHDGPTTTNGGMMDLGAPSLSGGAVGSLNSHTSLNGWNPCRRDVAVESTAIEEGRTTGEMVEGDCND